MCSHSSAQSVGLLPPLSFCIDWSNLKTPVLTKLLSAKTESAVRMPWDLMIEPSRPMVASAHLLEAAYLPLPLSFQPASCLSFVG